MTVPLPVVLLVEDDENTVFFVKQASSKVKAGHVIQAVNDGEQATKYLLGEGQYADRNKFPLPNIILLDLKMPRMSGLEFLEWVRHNPQCSIIPTIVLSGSQLESDVREAYRLGATSYMVKPVGLDKLIRLLECIFEYWSCCECPPSLKRRPHS